jgi:hypothetical protein
MVSNRFAVNPTASQADFFHGFGVASAAEFPWGQAISHKALAN